MSEWEPRVFLVGAGPGNPALLTLRAQQCLARADLVLYGDLGSARLLDLARPDAERLFVTDLGQTTSERQERSQQRMIEAARAGKCVVRLHGGDPFVFGHGAEDAQVLREALIPYEVVPGITAGLGAGVYAGIPLTVAAHAGAVALVAEEEKLAGGRGMMDWEALARFPGMLIVYRGLARLPRIVEQLVRHGKSPGTAAAIVEEATTGKQRTIRATLEELPAKAAGVQSPTVVLIGVPAEWQAEWNWSERRPLSRQRIVVTRPQPQAGDFAQRLEELGAVPLVLPVIAIQEPEDWQPVDEALARIPEFQWLVFTSANGVNAFMNRLRHRGRDLRALANVQLAAIGPGTADALRRYHLEPDLVPQVYRSEELAEALHGRVAGQRVLLARADRGREVLREQLGEVAAVEQVAVYAQREVVDPGSAIFEQLRRGEVDLVTLTSSNIARAFARALDADARARIEAGRVRLVSISPVTSEAVRQMGLPISAEATVYTMAGMVEAMIRLVEEGISGGP